MINTRTRNEKGASPTEYGLLVAGIAALIVAVIFAFGGVIDSVFGDNNPKKTPKSAQVSHATSAPTPAPNTDPRKGWVIIFELEPGSDAQGNPTGFTVRERCHGTRLIIVATTFGGQIAMTKERNSADCL